MKTIRLFYLEDCPYCHYAQRAIKELVCENPAYGKIEIDWIEESRQPDVAGRYDYYFVPTIFAGDRKLYEANPAENYEDCKRHVKEALDAVLGY